MSPTAALALCRFVHFLAAMMGFGASLYLRLHAPEALRRALAPPIGRLVIAASLIALATAVLWLVSATASIADDWGAAADPEAILSVLADTAFGRAWSAHLAFAAAFATAALVAPRDEWTWVAALAGLTLASLGLVGHATIGAGALGLAHRASHALHLIAAGAWIGGLAPFVLTLDASARPSLRRDAVTAMMRFSTAGHFIVIAIVATGAVDVALTSGRLPLPPSTPYRALLDAKIAVVALMIGLALVNRYALAPRLRRSARALSAMWRFSLANVGLGALVIALVSVFGALDPT